MASGGTIVKCLLSWHHKRWGLTTVTGLKHSTMFRVGYRTQLFNVASTVDEWWDIMYGLMDQTQKDSSSNIM